MSRYADVDALLAWYDERRAEARYRLMDGKKQSVRREARSEISLFDQMYFKICRLIEQTPDVEEVTRCKDCKFRYTQTCFAKHETSDNDFCSCGAKMNKE